jgi:hypothetical protein
MNKKAQGGILYWWFIIGIFTIMYWFGGIAGLVQDIGRASVTEAGTTGLNGWFYSNINIFMLVFNLVAFAVLARMSQ